MSPIYLGDGLAPDVTFLDGLCYVAYGATEGAWLVGYQHDGAGVGRMALEDGFYNSWPRFGGEWVGYKTARANFVPAVVVVGAENPRFFALSADGNWPLFITIDGVLYWQTGNAYDVWRGWCDDGSISPTGQHGAPDGIERLDGPTVICRKDTRDSDPTVGGYPVRAGDLTVGQYGYGIGVRLDGEAVRWIAGDPSDDHPTPRCATDGTLYAITSSGQRGVRLWLLTRAEILALPPTPLPDPGPDPEPEPPKPEPEPEPIPPIPPKPEPPKPEPIPPYPPVETQPMTEQGWFIGPGDKVLACDAQGRVSFDRTELTDGDLLQKDPIDGDYRDTVRPVAHLDIYLTTDGTKFTPSGSVCLQYYGAREADVLGPDGKPGWYQRWAFGQWDNGLVTALVPYIEQGADNGRHWAGSSLTWVKKT